MRLRRFARFALTGGFNTFVHGVIVALFFQKVLADAVMANGVAFLVATFLSYQINARWTFRSRRDSRQLIRFLLVSLLGLLLTLLISALARNFGFSVFEGTLLVLGLMPPISFILEARL